jgi:hypothetical protein
MMALCPDCDGQGRTLVTYGLLGAARGPSPKTLRMLETVALRVCAICDGAGWYDPSHGR